MSEKVQAKYITSKYLEKLTGVAHSTIRIYLCRSEFSHITHTTHKKKGTYYYNVTMQDIKNLKELAFSARKRTGRLKNESQ